MNETEKIAQKTDSPYRVIDGKALIVVPSSSTTYLLSEVGTRVWQLANGKRRLKEIASIICKEYNVRKENAIKDVIEFAKNLEREGTLKLK